MPRRLCAIWPLPSCTTTSSIPTVRQTTVHRLSSGARWSYPPKDGPFPEMRGKCPMQHPPHPSGVQVAASLCITSYQSLAGSLSMHRRGPQIRDLASLWPSFVCLLGGRPRSMPGYRIGYRERAQHRRNKVERRRKRNWPFRSDLLGL